jgi:hypothetical protein
METTATNTRTDPVFKGTTPTNTVNLGITTACSMLCPKCSVGVPKFRSEGRDKHASVRQIITAGDVMSRKGPLRRVHLTGGEPTVHPNFGTIALLVRSWFYAKYLTIETNGAELRAYSYLFREPSVFDRVFITHYLKDSVYKGCPDNTETIQMARCLVGDRLIVEPPVTHQRAHVPLGRVLTDSTGRVGPCSKWHDPGLPCAWYNDRLYPCCVTVGINEEWSIPVTEDWRTEILKVPMGCERCCYRGT